MAKITEIMLLQQAERHALVIENQGDIHSFSRMIGEGFMKIGNYLEELNGLTTDVPFAEYPGFESMDGKNFGFKVGFYTAQPFPDKGEISCISIPARKIVVCLHQGNYDELAALYREMMEWIKEKGFKANGASIEHYYTGPEEPLEKHITRVVMPLES